jgi:protein-tyrosine-phosphatase
MSGAKTIAFVCLHGSAKSLIAAEYLNRRARERGLTMSATTSGSEADPVVPAYVIEGLRRRYIDPSRSVPERVAAQALASADCIVSLPPAKPMSRCN